MPVDEKLLEILRCPVTHQTLRLLTGEELAELNERIGSGDVRYGDDGVVEQSLEEGLVTDDGAMVYRVDDGIPIMLVEKVIRRSSR